MASALRRTRERIGEALRAPFERMPRAEILNYCAMSTAPRIGGVAVQLQARLRVERRMRPVALLDPRRGIGLREALARTGAKLLHIEGTFGVNTSEILSLGVPFIVSVHDLSADRALLAAAVKVVYPSEFLRDAYGVDGAIVEPGIGQARELALHGVGQALSLSPAGVAFAGAVRAEKGSDLLAPIARLIDRTVHVFGGGDTRELRRTPNVIVHGYYVAGTLPSLLMRHRIGTVVLPSLVPEAFSLVLSESWLAGAAVVSFDHGAIAERIRREGGGWLAPLESGAAGLAELINRRERIDIPRHIATAEEAAMKYAEIYAAASRARMIVAAS